MEKIMEGFWILKRFNRVPPQALQDLLVKKLNDYHSIRNARFEGLNFVSERAPNAFGNTGELVMTMIEGCVDGFKAALPPLKPYSIQYDLLKIKPGISRQDLYERGVLRYDDDELPDECYRSKRVVETFETWETASARRSEVAKLSWWYETKDDKVKYKNVSNVNMDPEKQYHF